MKRERPDPIGSGLFGFYGWHWPQGEYPWASSASRLPVYSRRFSALMSAAPAQPGSWNFMERVLRM